MYSGQTKSFTRQLHLKTLVLALELIAFLSSWISIDVAFFRNPRGAMSCV